MKPSKIDRIPLELRQLLDGWRDAGQTIEEILGKAVEHGGFPPISKSGLQRYLQLRQERATQRALIDIARTLPDLLKAIDRLIEYTRHQRGRE